MPRYFTATTLHSWSISHDLLHVMREHLDYLFEFLLVFRVFSTVLKAAVSCRFLLVRGPVEDLFQKVCILIIILVVAY